RSTPARAGRGGSGVRARRRVRGSDGSAVVHVMELTPGSDSIRAGHGGRGMRLSWGVIVSALIAAGCGGDAVGGESPIQGHSYIVGIDISGSRTKTEMDESKKLLDGVIDRLQPGDHLTLIEVYQGGREPAKQWSDSI